MINFCGAYIDSHEKEMLSQLSVTSMIDTCWRDGARQESFYLTHQQVVLARQYGGARSRVGPKRLQTIFSQATMNPRQRSRVC